MSARPANRAMQVAVPVTYRNLTRPYLEARSTSDVHRTRDLNPDPAWVEEIGRVEALITDLKKREKAYSVLGEKVLSPFYNGSLNSLINAKHEIVEKFKRVQQILADIDRQNPYDRPALTAGAKWKKISSDLFTQFRGVDASFQARSRMLDGSDVADAPTGDAVDVTSPPSSDESTGSDPGERKLLGQSSIALDISREEKRQEQKENHRQIGQLVSDIDTLSTLFTDMNHMVVAQGEIVNRIDENIFDALEETKKGTKEIVVAEKRSRGTCSCYALIIMLIVMAILIIVVAVKFSR